MTYLAVSVKSAGYYDSELKVLNKYLSDGWEVSHVAQMADGAIFILKKNKHKHHENPRKDL